MRNPYRVQTVKMTSGERLPVLIDTRTGLPLFDPTVFALTQLRARGLASNTIDQALRHVMLLLLFLDQRDIDLEARFRDGRLLELFEIEDLANACSQQLSCFLEDGDRSRVAPARRTHGVAQLRSGNGAKTRIDSESAGTRLRSIAKYLAWLSNAYLLKLSTSTLEFQVFQSRRDLVVEALRARVPTASGRNGIGRREGLARDAVTRLLSVTAASSPDNPWKSSFARQRNELIFKWLYSFGLRRGELLNIKISDIDFRKEEFAVVRRADAVEDPRTEQPTVKTKDRLIPIAPELCRLTHEHIVTARRQLSGARTHEYLFSADKTGAPLSLSSLNKLFAFLRKQIPDLPDDISPHVLRHTWNDKFSAAMDRLKTPEADEQKMRSFLMGWSETSDTAAIYTRRHIRKRANEVSLHMQSTMTDNTEI